MSLSLLAILAAFAVLVLVAVLRLVRVRSGRDVRPDGWKLLVLLLAVLIAPPIGLAIAAGPPPARGQSHALEAILLYFVALGLFALLMAIGAALVRRFAPADARPMLIVALVGREANELDVPIDPPLTASIRDGVDLVNARNVAFPRGSAFLEQQRLPGFEAAWHSLDDATQQLEGLIADNIAAGTGVARLASDTAADARSRLETLRRAATAGGQIWAT